jgi:hypothetical protein
MHSKRLEAPNKDGSTQKGQKHTKRMEAHKWDGNTLKGGSTTKDGNTQKL